MKSDKLDKIDIRKKILRQIIFFGIFAAFSGYLQFYDIYVFADENKKKSSSDQLIIKVTSGRIREEPSLNGDVEFGMKKGDVATRLKKEGKWFFIKIDDGRTGWGHESLFEPSNIQDEISKTEREPQAKAKTADKKRKEPSAKPVIKQEQTKTAILERIWSDIKPGEDERVFLKLNGLHLPDTFVMKDAMKVICDFPGVRPDKSINSTITVNGRLVRQIRVGLHSNPDKLRVVIDLEKISSDIDVNHAFFKKENIYLLSFKEG